MFKVKVAIWKLLQITRYILGKSFEIIATTLSFIAAGLAYLVAGILSLPVMMGSTQYLYNLNENLWPVCIAIIIVWMYLVCTYLPKFVKYMRNPH